MTKDPHFCVTALRYVSQRITAVQCGLGDGRGARSLAPDDAADDCLELADLERF